MKFALLLAAIGAKAHVMRENTLSLRRHIRWHDCFFAQFFCKDFAAHAVTLSVTLPASRKFEGIILWLESILERMAFAAVPIQQK
jgi:hypothetical protein